MWIFCCIFVYINHKKQITMKKIILILLTLTSISLYSQDTIGYNETIFAEFIIDKVGNDHEPTEYPENQPFEVGTTGNVIKLHPKVPFNENLKELFSVLGKSPTFKDINNFVDSLFKYSIETNKMCYLDCVGSTCDLNKSTVLNTFRIDLLNDIKVYNDNDIKIRAYNEVTTTIEKNGDVSGYWIFFEISNGNGGVIGEIDITLKNNNLWSINYCNYLQ